MSRRFAIPSALALGAAALLATPPALAQSSTSWLPYTQNGYVGINVGRPEYKLGCGAGAFACDDPDASFNVYTGGLFNEWLGAEVGYLHFGRADRQGGKTRGHGLNLSVLGQIPLYDGLRIFGKAGVTYGRTDVTTSALSTEPNGDDSGFGPSYGVGVGWDFSNAWGAVLQWERHEMKFVGRDRQRIDNASLGVVFRF